MKGPRVVTVHASELAACPELRLDPAHYRSNGLCWHVASGIAEVDGQLRTTCCDGPVGVTRVVHDLIDYAPRRLEEGTLVVSFGRVAGGLDSDAYEVTCDTCDGPIDVEVEED